MTDNSITLALYAQTDVGMVRSGNEDNFLILDLSTGQSWTASEAERKDLLTYIQGYYGSLLAVSDGMGGALAGEVASRMAVETVRDRMLQLQAHEAYGKLPFQERLRLAVEEANLLINQESGSNPQHKGLGATFTAVATLGDQLYFAQVGDSRAYLIRQGKIARITKDQSLVQQLIDAGQITEEEAETHSYRNVILQALGAHSSVNVEVSTLRLRQLDTLLLCSDGLSGKMHADEIARIVSAAPDLKTACGELIDLANERGGEDNITVVLAQFSGGGLALPDRQLIEPEIIARSPDTPTEVDLRIGARTQPFDQVNDSLPSASSTAPIARVTGEVKTPVVPSSPPAAPKPPPTDNGLSGDPAAPRRPITSVFAAPDFEEDEQVIASLRQPQPAVTTAATTQRRTKSLAADEETSAAEGQAGTDFEEVRDYRHPEAESAAGPKLALVIIGSLLLLGLIAGSLFWYWNRARTAHQAEVQQQERERQQQEQLQARIGGLRERIANLSKRTSQADTPAAKQLLERLSDLTQRLDAAAALLPLNKVSEANQICNEVENSFGSLEREFERLSGLPPNRQNKQQPVQC